MTFIALDVAFEICGAVAPLLGRIRQSDPDLASQAKRAASSVPLNLAEGRRRKGRDRLHAWRIAAGSADELCTALRLAQAWGYLTAEELAPSLALLDRQLALCWRLTREPGA